MGGCRKINKQTYKLFLENSFKKPGMHPQPGLKNRLTSGGLNADYKSIVYTMQSPLQH